MTICLGWLAFHYHGKYTAVQDDISSQETITGNILTTINLMQDIAKATHDDKNAIALESQRAKADIKAAVTGDACADSPVPAGAVNRLRDYANSVRSGTSSSATH
ncbi:MULTISPECIES: hypothetical protein [unclassified Serratia (in: enterobacteria)]|uniref:hypothetical protein n=1 Tax=unclassified Serratia (in: enterobacteria) TaxID=2647522 RepID=UPI0006903BF7|nr:MULTISPECIES: hypothetical protein [unclassified Serratia (in: enterobacteria)]